MSGCSSDSPPAPTSSPSATVALPGGAAIVVSPGSPSACARLADSPAIRGLGSALIDLTLGENARSAVDTLHRAALDLRDIASAVDGAVKQALLDAASALDQVVSSGRVDESLQPWLSALGEEVQELCHFPLG